MSAPCPLVVMEEAASLLVGCPDPAEADAASFRLTEARAAVAELVAQARNLDAILHHPDRSVTFLDADRLHAALAKFGGAR